MCFLLNRLLSCLGNRPQQAIRLGASGPLDPPSSDEADDATAKRFVDVLLSAEKPGRDLHRELEDVISTSSFTESIAIRIIHTLEDAVEKGTPAAMAFKDSLDRARSEATIFACDHPVFVTIIVLGVLCLLAPNPLEWLGFAELGPVEGEWRISRTRVFKFPCIC